MVERSRLRTPKENAMRRPKYLMHLRDEIDQLFDRFPKSGWIDPMFNDPMQLHRQSDDVSPQFLPGIPAIDVVEKADLIEIVAEVPGLTAKEMEIEVVDNRLVISGSKEEERKEGAKDSNYFVTERSFGSFERSVPIPESIDQEKIEASVKNGILTVHMLKKPDAGIPKKKIRVKPA